MPAGLSRNQSGPRTGPAPTGSAHPLTRNRRDVRPISDAFDARRRGEPRSWRRAGSCATCGLRPAMPSARSSRTALATPTTASSAVCRFPRLRTRPAVSGNITTMLPMVFERSRTSGRAVYPRMRSASAPHQAARLVVSTTLGAVGERRGFDQNPAAKLISGHVSPSPATTSRVELTEA